MPKFKCEKCGVNYYGWCVTVETCSQCGGKIMPAETKEVVVEKTRIVKCAYCGMEYHQDTPACGDKVITDHIKTCSFHPMRQAEEKIAILRKALIGLVGSETKEELNNMELALRTIVAPDADKVAGINAIHALLETMPVASEA